MELAIPGKVESKFHRAYSGQFFGFFGLTSIQISNKKKTWDGYRRLYVNQNKKFFYIFITKAINRINV